MAELDYAFLAEYASTTGGSLTVVGASFTTLQVPVFPTQITLYMAGRVRAPKAADECTLRLSVSPPDDSYQLEGEAVLDPTGQEPYFEDRVGLLLSVAVPLPLPDAGLYTVRVFLDSVPVRELKFTAESVG